MLLGYLPVDSIENASSQPSRRRMATNLFHACMEFLLQDIVIPGTEGVNMRSGDGVVRSCHPIYAIYVGDYPEQTQAATVKKGQCPTCQIEPGELGAHPYSEDEPPPFYDLGKILEVHKYPDHRDWPTRCEEAGVKPVFRPFWETLPYADPFLSITPDILHQIHQGIFKHLISWLKKLYGDAEIDARCQRLPPNSHCRLFTKGIYPLSNLTGREHADIARIILGVIIDLPLKYDTDRSTAEILSAVRAMLDFIYLAQYPVHTDRSLHELEEALLRFHDHKDIFIELGARKDFEINKLHYAIHYRYMIQRFGTTDNYNTEQTERLHIPYAKEGFRHSNQKNELPQMTQYIERKEKILEHEKFINWCLAGKPDLVSIISHEVPPRIQMTKFPSQRGVPIPTIISKYCASQFEHALSHFVLQRHYPNLTYAEIEAKTHTYHLPISKVSVYHKAKFWLGDKENHRLLSDEMDVVHARPFGSASHAPPDDDLNLDPGIAGIPGRFDIVLVNDGHGQYAGIEGYRAAQVKVIFTLTKTARQALFSSTITCPQYLAYVEWFKPFKPQPQPRHLFYEISRASYQGHRVASIIPLSNIKRSLHLFPKFGQHSVNRDYQSSTILEDFNTFYVNCFSDRHAFHTIV